MLKPRRGYLARSGKATPILFASSYGVRTDQLFGSKYKERRCRTRTESLGVLWELLVRSMNNSTRMGLLLGPLMISILSAQTPAEHAVLNIPLNQVTGKVSP